MAEPAEVPGFVAFVGSRGDALQHTAYLMTGDAAAAEQLLVTGLAAAWTRWSRVAGDPEPLVRRAMAEAAAPRWHRGTSREPAALLAVDDELLPDWPDPLTDPDDDPEQRTTDRVAAVSRQAHRRRRSRRRVGAGALVGVLALAAVAGAKALQPQHHRPTPAAAPKRVVTSPNAATIPTYYNGGKLLNSTKVDVSRAGSTAFTVTPTRLGLDFAFRCPVVMSGTARFQIRVGGSLVLETGCVGSDPGGGIGGSQVLSVDGSIEYGDGDPTAAESLRQLGVRLGRPTAVVVTVVDPAFAVTPPPLVTIGVYQDVPFGEYPLPTRPSRILPPADIGLAIGHPQQVVTPGGAANGTWTTRVRYSSDLVVSGAILAPGQVRVELDGHLVGGLDAWDYDDASLDVTLGPPLPSGVKAPRPGQLVTVTVTMSHFSRHDWKLALGQSSS